MSRLLLSKNIEDGNGRAGATAVWGGGGGGRGWYQLSGRKDDAGWQGHAAADRLGARTPTEAPGTARRQSERHGISSQGHSILIVAIIIIVVILIVGILILVVHVLGQPRGWHGCGGSFSQPGAQRPLRARAGGGFRGLAAQ
jgi:hypothetical protein